MFITSIVIKITNLSKTIIVIFQSHLIYTFGFTYYYTFHSNISENWTNVFSSQTFYSFQIIIFLKDENILKLYVKRIIYTNSFRKYA